MSKNTSVQGQKHTEHLTMTGGEYAAAAVWTLDLTVAGGEDAVEDGEKERESDPSKFGNASGFSGKEQVNGSNGTVAGPSQDMVWFKSVYAEKTPQLERSTSFHSDLNDKRPVESELLRSAQKEPLFDEIESIVRIKQAEAKMFQVRADDARREAEGLKLIVIAKSEKIEEEYAGRFSKLHIVEAEEMRKQKYEEFQALERAHREYFSMKMRMEADIKNLLLKMEATKRNLTM